MADLHPVYPTRRNAHVPSMPCAHALLDGANVCLDCGEFIESTSAGTGELCIYCCTDPATDACYPYCCATCAIDAQS